MGRANALIKDMPKMNKAPIFHITIAAILSLGVAAIGKAQTRDFPLN